MGFVAVTAEHGIVIRRRALAERDVSYQAVLTALEADQPFGTDEELLTFGPSFGPEALEALTQRLIALGLVYFDDFFEFVSDLPLWCKFAVTFVPTNSE
jgi:hypothetical protein